MLFAVKLIKIVLSALCALCALLAMASVISIWALLIVIGIYIGVSLAAEKITPAAPAQSRPVTKRHKQIQGRSGAQKYNALFGIITGLMPLMFLVLLELVLRGAGFNHSYPLFVDSPVAPGYMQVNPEVVKRFLVQESPASSIQPGTSFFLKDKPADEFRIVVLGESSAAGFPYGHFGSLAGILEQRLKRTFPDRPIKVISTAMSAINTYALLDFTDEIIEQKPDAVLIYTGHNEYLGILGVGSAYSVSGSRETTLAFLKLRSLRLFQVIKDAYYGMSSGRLAPGADKNVMVDIARDREIAYGSPVFEAGVAQFEGNLEQILVRYRQANVPVLIGTFASNERDLAPFVSKLAPGVDENRWEQTYREGLAALEREDLQAANVAFSKALLMDPTAADAYYAQGRVYEKQNNFQEAQIFYLAARDYDQLRFRAPEVFNDMIRQLAAEHGATVVDVQAALRQEATNHIIGNDLMLEHVHPNARGYFLLSDAYYEALRERDMIGSWENAIPKETAWQEVPLTEVDLLCGRYKIEQLTTTYPFKETPSTPNVPEPVTLVEKLAYGCYYGTSAWHDETLQLLQYYEDRNDLANATRVALILADAAPFYPEYQTLAGGLLVQGGKAGQALPYLKQAAALSPQEPGVLFDLANAYQLAGRTGQARATLAILLQIAPNYQPALDLLDSLD